MPVAAHQSLFQIPWIRTDAEHLEIVIGFKNQHVRAVKLLCDSIRKVSDIGELRDFYAVVLNAERNRLGRVVRYAERQDFRVADRLRIRCQIEVFELQRASGIGRAFDLGDRVCGETERNSTIGGGDSARLELA